MKETPLSLCEKSSLISNLQANIRLDGRGFNEIRPIEIYFGKDYGCCTVTLGETRVLTQVTCEVVEPRPSRPNEGKLSLAVHLSPMAAAHFELGKGHELTDELQKILDGNIKESRCVDLESLCIVAEETVWQFKVDVTVLNHAGNLADACNLSAVSALRHFHRPDVTVEEDGRVTLHTQEERDLIPTFLKRIPVCLSYALFSVGDNCITIADPTEKEERVMTGKLIIGLNPHGEITSLLFPGKVCVEKHFIMSCISRSYIKAKSIAETVLNKVEADVELRKTTNDVTGYLNILKSDTEYCKTIIMDRIQGIRKMGQDFEENDHKMDIEEPSTITANKREVSEDDSHVNLGDSSDSDEEFSKESLRKTLPEIKAAKISKKKKSKMVKKETKDFQAN